MLTTNTKSVPQIEPDVPSFTDSLFVDGKLKSAAVSALEVINEPRVGGRSQEFMEETLSEHFVSVYLDEKAKGFSDIDRTAVIGFCFELLNKIGGDTGEEVWERLKSKGWDYMQVQRHRKRLTDDDDLHVKSSQA